MAKGKQEFDLVPLIIKVKENTILYDQSHEDFGDPIKTNRAWNGIARQLLLPNGEVVRCKWKNTCDIYVKSLKGNKKNAPGKWPWAEHMKFFEPYLTGEKTVGEKKNQDTPISTPTKKTVAGKRQRSPAEVATSQRFSRSLASVEEPPVAIESSMKKARIVVKKMAESKVTPSRTPRKSVTVKASSQRLPRSASRALESQESNNDDDSQSSTSDSSYDTARKPASTVLNKSPMDSSQALPKVITPDMRKGPNRLPRSVLKAMEAEAAAETSNILEHSQQFQSSPISRRVLTKASTSAFNQTFDTSQPAIVGSRSSTRSQRQSLDPKLTHSVHSPLRSARYSTIPENLSSKEHLLEETIPSSRFSSSGTFVTSSSSPGNFSDTLGYFESLSREPNRKDAGTSASEKRSIYSSSPTQPASSFTSDSRRLPRSAALEMEFARRDAMLDQGIISETLQEDDSISNRNHSQVPIAPAVKETLDATDLLFLSHALTVKSFSERKQLEVKKKIARIIAQAEIQEVD